MVAFVGVVNGLYKLHRCDGGDEHNLLKPGDLIEYIRGPFSHWAIYLGHRKVAHLPGPSNIFANFQAKGEKENFFCMSFL